LRVPVFCSPLILVPMVSRMIGKGKVVGIVTAGARHLKGPFLENVGIDSSIPVAIAGMDDAEEFTAIHVTQTKQEVDLAAMEEEVVSVAERLVAHNPAIGALVLECSDLPPFASAIQQRVRLPIFDFITLAHFVYHAVVQTPYQGFL
jgi:hypothetical protein